MKTILTITFLLILQACVPNPRPVVSSAAPEKKSDAVKAAKSKNNIVPHFKNLAYPDFKYIPPHPKDYRVELENGHIAYMVPDTSLGLIHMEFYFTGSNLPKDPKEAAEIYVYSQLIPAGGTKDLTPSQLEDSLEFIAAGLNASINDQYANLELNALKENTQPLMALMKSAALEPRFDSEILKLQKKKYIEAIEHRFDRPQSILSRAYELSLYGRHPSNYLGTVDDVNAIKPKLYKNWVGRGFASKKIIISVAGYFNKDSMTVELNKLLKDFPKPNAQDSIPGFKGPAEAGVYLVDKDLTQANIKVGFPGVKRPHPDYYKLSLASYIFGSGGFTSRLTAKVRTDEGLAYSVRSFVNSSYDREETVGFALQTKVESGVRAIDLCFSEMEKMADSGVTDEELGSAKDALIQSLPSMFDSPKATASIFARSEIWGRDLDHFVKYPEIIAALTKEEILEAFKKYFVKEKARVVVVGPKGILNPENGPKEESLSKFGKLTELSEEDLLKNQ